MRTRVWGFRLVLLMTIIITILATGLPAWGTQLSGGRGLTMVQFPTLLDPGCLGITLHSRAFVKSIPAGIGLSGQAVPGGTVSDGTGAVSFNFGFSRHVEFGFTQVLYQDLNVSAQRNKYIALEQIPDDSYLRVKMGNYPLTIGNAYFKVGLLNQLRYRTGLIHNVYLEPYSGDGIGWEVDFLASWFANPLYENNALAMHLNLGYLNHNDAGHDTSVFRAAQEFVYGLAAVMPTRHFDFSLETHGSFFLREPRINSFSQMDYQWVTPAVRYKMFYGMSALVGVDVLLWKGEDKNTRALLDAMSQPEYPTFPGWRINGSISISPSTTFYREPTFSNVTDPLSTRKLLRERKSLFEWVVDDQQGVEYIDVELEKIKAERKKAEQELENLKQQMGNR
jgi:hypothetical protein